MILQLNTGTCHFIFLLPIAARATVHLAYMCTKPESRSNTKFIVSVTVNKQVKGIL